MANTFPYVVIVPNARFGTAFRTTAKTRLQKLLYLQLRLQLHRSRILPFCRSTEPQFKIGIAF